MPLPQPLQCECWAASWTRGGRAKWEEEWEWEREENEVWDGDGISHRAQGRAGQANGKWAGTGQASEAVGRYQHQCALRPLNVG